MHSLQLSKTAISLPLTSSPEEPLFPSMAAFLDFAADNVFYSWVIFQTRYLVITVSLTIITALLTVYTVVTQTSGCLFRPV